MKQLPLIVAFILVGCSSGSDKASGVRYGRGWSSDPAVTEVPQSPTESKVTGQPETKKPESLEASTKVVAKKPEYPKVIPNSPLAEAAIDAAIRKATEKPTGELTKADLEKVTHLSLHNNQLTEVKGLEKLTWLPRLEIQDNPDLTKAQIDQLQKALPKCKIFSNPTK